MINLNCSTKFISLQVIIPCTHTLCITCLNQLKEPTCPNCKKIYTDKNPNWILLDLIQNSNCDTLRANLDDHLKQNSKLKISLKENHYKRVQENEMKFKLIETQISNHTNELIKSIEVCKFKLLCESKHAEEEKKKELDKLYYDEDFKETKNLKNLNEDQLFNLQNSLIEKNKTLNSQLNECEILTKDNFEFSCNFKSLEIKTDFIGQFSTETNNFQVNLIFHE